MDDERGKKESTKSSFRTSTNLELNLKQRKRAKMARELHTTLGHPSDQRLKDLLNHGQLKGCDLTGSDVERAR